jgi:hypothetical protein
MIFMKTEPLGLDRDLLMVGAWVINLAVAELLIRHSVAAPALEPRRAHPAGASPTVRRGPNPEQG